MAPILWVLFWLQFTWWCNIWFLASRLGLFIFHLGPKMYHHFVDWPFLAVTRRARLLGRQGKGPERPYVDIEGYTKNAALVLIKNILKRWLRENPGFCIVIGGPGALARNVQTTGYYVRCFGETRFRNSRCSCIIDAACNVGYLLLSESNAASMSNRFSEFTWRASQRLRPHDEGKAGISDFISVGHLGLVL